jgi:hypothetical protein
MWVYSDFIDVYAKCSVLQHVVTLSTNYNITIKVGVKRGYLLTTIIIARNVTSVYKKNFEVKKTIFVEKKERNQKSLTIH